MSQGHGLMVLLSGDIDSFAPEKHESHCQPSHLRLLLRNVEGLKSTLELTANNLLQSHDILIMLETLSTKPIELNGFYAQHMPVTQGPRGRPMCGISCYYKPKVGKVLSTHQEEDTMIIN
ncbi:hypothetical protein ANN_17714 [Periplaneta americana]|uniref:Uncharacterized protein n=1 Tax=Periplaneta americana TaxID=6978 RepID=A0ABQ8SUP8_PERAM|nr:hypothetical protein ANN_17714 [Periplaneta americana]